MYYLDTYLIGIIIFFILSPLPYKQWGWEITGWNNKNPPPHIISLVWPAVLAGYIFYYSVFAAFMVFYFPFSWVERIHLWVAECISEAAQQNRREKKRSYH
jgi:hypothetical protein